MISAFYTLIRVSILINLYINWANIYLICENYINCRENLNLDKIYAKKGYLELNWS